MAVADTDLSQPGTYNSHFQKLAAATPGDVAAKMKRLQRELRNLNTKTQLPVHAAASIFVRHDSERIDKMRVIITGERLPPVTFEFHTRLGRLGVGCHSLLMLIHRNVRCKWEIYYKFLAVLRNGRPRLSGRGKSLMLMRFLVDEVILLLQVQKTRRTREDASSSTCSSHRSTLWCRR